MEVGGPPPGAYDKFSKVENDYAGAQSHARNPQLVPEHEESIKVPFNNNIVIIFHSPDSSVVMVSAAERQGSGNQSGVTWVSVVGLVVGLVGE
ncbi:hypothetical protein BGX31_011466 [Mortierella sp. GBA43]|nr:hypothetical protein BGX31_011466 [Mortierella sp. GBA43]